MRPFWQSEDAHLAGLARRAQGGDREAFRALYRALHPKVARFVIRRVRTAQDAEDLLAVTFERLLAQLDRLDPARGVAGFVLQIARNAIVDFHRTRHAADPLDQAAHVAPERDPLEAVLRNEQLAQLARALSELPREERELISLRCGDGLKHAEIAVVLGLTEDAVKQRFSRALKALRAGLDRFEGELAHDVP